MRESGNSGVAPINDDMPCWPNGSRVSILRKESGRVRLEISADRLRRLLQTGAVCVEDFRCLDCESKHCVWRLCLTNCTNRI